MNIFVFILFLIWFVVENIHFGWNAFPESDAELIADGIGLVLTATAIAKAKDGK